MSNSKAAPKELDSFFTGVGIAVGFLVVAGLLAFNETYFGNALATNIALIVFLLFGIVGLNTEIEKYTKKSINLNAVELFGATVFLAPWYWLQTQPHHWGWNILYVFLLLLGVTFAVRWIMSISNRFMSALSVDGTIAKLKTSGLVLTQVAALLAVIVKIIESLKLI